MRLLSLSLFGCFLWSLTGGVFAYPGGSPTCHVDDVVGPGGMGDPIPNMGYALMATPSAYTPGQPLTLSLMNFSQGMTVRGVLLYVEDPDALDGNMKPIKRGNFAAPYPAGLKAVFDGYQGCDFAGLTPVITHANDTHKSLPVSLEWQPPVIDTGTLRVRAIALMTFGAYQMLELELPLDPVFTDSFE